MIARVATKISPVIVLDASVLLKWPRPCRQVYTSGHPEDQAGPERRPEIVGRSSSPLLVFTLRLKRRRSPSNEHCAVSQKAVPGKRQVMTKRWGDGHAPCAITRAFSG